MAALLLVTSFFTFGCQLNLGLFFFLATVCNTLCFHLPDKKKKKEESKVPLRDIKEKTPDEDKKKDKPKAHAPSHTKIRSIGKVVVMRSEYHWP